MGETARQVPHPSMPPQLIKHRWPARKADSARPAHRDDTRSHVNHDPRLRRRTERRQPRVVHDDALWHEGPDHERTRKTRRHEGPREPRRDHPTPDAEFDGSR